MGVQKLVGFLWVFLVIFTLAFAPNPGFDMALPYCRTGGSPTCNNKDPYAYWCSEDGYVVSIATKYATAGSGTVRSQMYYSPDCIVNWTFVQNTSPGAVRHLRAELWNSSQTTQLMAYESNVYVWIWTNMYDGTVVRCARGRQGPVGPTFDAVTLFGCG